MHRMIVNKHILAKFQFIYDRLKYKIEVLNK
jgi:hypothetical protein